MQKTVLHDRHAALGAKLVDFAGWEMPIQYDSQIAEHNAVRQAAGMFDVSHMAVVDIEGPDALAYLRHLLANDVAKLVDGQALYSCMLSNEGGVLDDLIVYRRAGAGAGASTDAAAPAGTRFRTVVNAATREKDLAWMQQHLDGFDASITYRDDLAMIAVQGPKARELALPLLPEPLSDAAAALKPFNAVEVGDDGLGADASGAGVVAVGGASAGSNAGAGWFVARTGYTGEDGFEIILPDDQAVAFWDALAAAGVKPCGLGARDTLRLEAGMNLYGQDMDEDVTPLECGLAWTVDFGEDSGTAAGTAAETAREFIGREALLAQRAGGVARKLIGVVLEERGVLRGHQRITDGRHDGELTSGSFSPTLGKAIGLARVPAEFVDAAVKASKSAESASVGSTGTGSVDAGSNSADLASPEVEIRGRMLPVRVVRPPFVRNGKARV